MQETAVVALATFFATIGPLDVAAMYAGMTADATPLARRHMALRGTLVAAIILFTFALFGQTILIGFGISLPALRTAGGILLLLIAIDMVFARHSGAVSTTDDEEQEASHKSDVSVFPLATPLIAGPGAMGATILLMADAGHDLLQKVVVAACLGVMLIATLAALLLASQIQRLFGVTGLSVIGRVFGVILAALAVQFVFDGIRESGLLAR